MLVGTTDQASCSVQNSLESSDLNSSNPMKDDVAKIMQKNNAELSDLVNTKLIIPKTIFILKFFYHFNNFSRIT